MLSRSLAKPLVARTAMIAASFIFAALPHAALAGLEIPEGTQPWFTVLMHGGETYTVKREVAVTGLKTVVGSCLMLKITLPGQPVSWFRIKAVNPPSMPLVLYAGSLLTTAHCGSGAAGGSEPAMVITGRVVRS
jgi:hypothetical protein